ncbi:hypothetical protein [Paraherbaspirillum soli]|uniref:Uncharacterized protein n=1 Tax=Paraherbaspirillum soli TaxID=631222 RepID=A0ABW0MFC0_9BURK
MTFAITPDKKLICPETNHLDEAIETARLGMICLDEVLRLLRPARELSKRDEMVNGLIHSCIEQVADRHNLFDVMRAEFESKKTRKE